MTDAEKARLDQRMASNTMLRDFYMGYALMAMRDPVMRVYERTKEGHYEAARELAGFVATAAKILADELVKARGQ